MMKEPKKWKYKDRITNSLNVGKSDYIETKEREKLLNFADESEKAALSELFEFRFKKNYDRYKIYMHKIHFFMFRDLEYHVKESVNCLIIGACIASITNTNLILEKALKLALIQYEVGELCDYDDEIIINKYIEANRQYSGKSMERNIQRCTKYKILNSEEANELTQYKLKFRDGFSHFTPRHILKGENNLVYIDFPINNSKMEKRLKMPSYQSDEVRQFAINNAEQHLKYVLEIINHLQFKVLERFGKNLSKSNK